MVGENVLKISSGAEAAAYVRTEAPAMLQIASGGNRRADKKGSLLPFALLTRYFKINRL